MLSQFQTLIANHVNGHAKVLAGAGSGKTTTMVSRVNYLVAGGLIPGSVLSVMFNADARDSYRDKLLKTYSKKDCPPVFTFHGFGSALIKELVHRKVMPKYRLETSDYNHYQFALTVLTPWLVKIKAKRRVTLEFISFVDLVKNSIKAPAKVFIEYEIDEKYRFFVEAYEAYELERIDKLILFFSDLIYTPVMMIQNDKELRTLFADRYEQIIVDEFQDISEIQMLMIQLVAGTRASVMAVGDDDQCIYSWRGAKPHYLISTFEEVFKNATVFQLPQTYRFGHQVSLAAAYLIKNNVNRSPKLGFSAPNASPTCISLDLEQVGQSSIARQLNQWTSQGRRLNEVAILVRSYSHSVTTELALLHAGLPYFIEGGKAFFETAELGALMAALHVAAGTYKTLDKKTQRAMLFLYLKTPNTALPYDQLTQLMEEAEGDLSNPADAIDVAVDRITEDWIKERVAKKGAAWRNLEALITANLEEVFRQTMEEMGLKEFIEATSTSDDDSEERWAKFEAFLAYAIHTGYDLKKFMLFLEALRSGQAHHKKEDDVILITSIHRSKGLEWPFVIMPNLVQGRFPHIPRNGQNIAPIEDERRLFYVGMTRAQERVVFIAPKDEDLSFALANGIDQPNGKVSNDGIRASQFLYEMNVFVSQRADQLLSGRFTLPSGIESAITALDYIKVAQGAGEATGY